MRNTEWTGQQMARLVRLCEQGSSYREAGEALGRTRNSIAGKAHLLGLRFKGANRKKNTPAHRAAIVAGLMKFREMEK